MSMNERQDRAYQILADRGVWERKQRLYYTMRHDGLRRTSKPFPTAADSHFPLIDMHIGDLKPFWVAQAFGGDRLADFVCLKEQLGTMTEAAADYFDFNLRYFTNFRYVMEQCVDTMLLRGRGILKAICDPFDGYKIKFKNIDPLYLLMAEQYDDFDDADYWVEIQRISIHQYKRNRNFNQAEDVINAIRGKQDYMLQGPKNDKYIREGVTHSNHDDEVILWVYHQRTPSGISVSTWSPQAWNKEVRKDYMIPYRFDGQVSCPFKSITMEIKDEGWYSPRGLAELNAAFENYATKLWNNKSDVMSFTTTPLFTGDKDLNQGNIRFTPGQYVPGNVQAIQMPQPSGSFSEEMNFTRALSEQRSRTPDFGQFAPDENGGAGRPVTATQSRITSGLQAVGADHNGDVFRQVRLLAIFKHVWALMLHGDELQSVDGKPPALTYYASNNLQELNRQAVHDKYLVIPAGGSANKSVKLQRAVTRFQLFRGAQNVDQDGLVRDVLSADDARLVSKLLIPTQQKQGMESYQEALELIVMAEGHPVPVLPGQDHYTRIVEDIQYLHAQSQLGKPVNPAAMVTIHQHIAQHFAYLQKTQPQAAQQIKAMVLQAEQSPAQQQPSNVAQMPQQGQGAGGQPPQQQGPKLSESIAIKMADLYPSERAQVLQQWGIQAADANEMTQTEEARARIKAITTDAKPKVGGALQ